MPHVSIKYFAQTLADQHRAELILAITHAVTRAFDCDEGVVSIALEGVQADQWQQQVYSPEIEGRRELLAKVPNY